MLRKNKISIEVTKGDCTCKLDLMRPTIRGKHVLFSQGPFREGVGKVWSKIILFLTFTKCICFVHICDKVYLSCVQNRYLCRIHLT